VIKLTHFSELSTQPNRYAKTISSRLGEIAFNQLEYVAALHGNNPRHHSTELRCEFQETCLSPPSSLQYDVVLPASYRHAALLTVLILASTSLHAQPLELRFDRISLEQGLSDLTVFSLAQDSAGFLWFGTSDGLNKYDGYTFTVFRPDPTDTNSLTAAPINDMCVDRSGTLWLATGSGLSTMHPDSAAPRRFPQPPGPRLPFSTTCVQPLRDGSIGVGTWEGFYIYKPSTDEFTRVDFDTLDTLIVTTFVEARDGTLWIGAAHKGLVAYHPATKKQIVFRKNERDPRKLPGDLITRILEDRNGRIWVATQRGLCRLDDKRESFLRYTRAEELDEDIIEDIIEDHRGQIWVGGHTRGLALYRPETDSFVRHMPDPDDPQSINSERLTRMFEDRGGVLWCGTYRAGLNRLNAKRSAFKRYVVKSKAGTGILSPGVYSIMEDSRGSVWIGSYQGGLSQYNQWTGTYTYHKPSPKVPNSISGDNPLSLLESSTGELWVGNYGLDRVDRETGKFIHYPLADEKHRLGELREVKTLTETRDGMIWFGTFGGGLHRFNPRSRTMRAYKNLGGDEKDPVSPGIWAILEDRRGRLWLGSYGLGVFVMDRNTETFTRFVYDAKRASCAPSVTGIYDIHEDKSGILWIGTMGGGLTRVHPDSLVFRHFTTREGLPNNFVKGIEEDARGYLWLSTDFGISRFDPRTETFVNIKEEDGLMGNVFLSGAHFTSKTGRMYFGGEKGAVSFHPDSLLQNTHVPPVVITGVRVLNRPHSMSSTREFAHDQNSLEFEFVALDFTNPDRNRYAYIVEGLDEHWTQAGERRYANYPHLAPGSYTFRVKGSNNDGVWNEQGTSYAFTILPPFWKTAWFISIAALALIGISVAAYNYRVNRLLEIERLRVRIASDLHDDVGSSLTRISLQSELIQEGIEPEEQQNYLKNIATMSRELVTAMSDIVWSIDSRNDSVENILDKMRNFGSTVLSTKDVNFNLAHSGLDVKKKLSVDVRENLYLIYKEAINNIAKHANASKVNVILRNDSDKFTMTIIDDGKGWEGNERPSGHGTRNMKMRAERLGGRVEFVRDDGTRVVLTRKRL
jgi:ligand-binding sensor domain-containing protein/two-component sensor histidine kinase